MSQRVTVHVARVNFKLETFCPLGEHQNLSLRNEDGFKLTEDVSSQLSGLQSAFEQEESRARNDFRLRAGDWRSVEIEEALNCINVD